MSDLFWKSMHEYPERIWTLLAVLPGWRRQFLCRNALLLPLMACLCGCTHLALRNNTVRTSSTWSDILFRQVLDNVARFHDNPDTIPSFSLATAGTVSITDQAGAGVSPTYSPTLTFFQQGGGALPILSLLFPLSIQRQLSENWSLTPITDADNLRNLRCAYRLLILGRTTPNYAFCEEQMKDFFAGETADLADYFPPQGWFHVGKKHDVPANACYVGHHDKTYVWVTPDGMNDLTVFAMGALNLATGKPNTPQETVVRTYKGEPKPENLVQTQVTTTQDDEAALKAIREGRVKPPPRQRNLDYGPFNPGLWAIPRK